MPTLPKKVAAVGEGEPPSGEASSLELLRLALGEHAEGSVEELLREAGVEGAAALIPGEAVYPAVLSLEGVWIDPGAERLLPGLQDRAEIKAVAERARAEGQARAAAPDDDGGAVLVWGLSGAAADAWIRNEAGREALKRRGAVLVLLFAPARSSPLAARAMAAFGLTAAEARIAEAFLFAPTIEVAAEQAGVSRATARDAMGRITAKMGVRRSSDVVRRLSELMCGGREAGLAADLLREIFGLSPAESQVAAVLAAGATQREAAEALALSPETVRSYAKSVLMKSGAPRLKDFVRLATEATALAGFAHAVEPVFVSGEASARLRLSPRDGGRRLAVLDYGPASGRPAILFHGFLAGRSLPPAMVRSLQARGFRPLVPQRPGFGLTSPAKGDYLATAAEDLAALVEALGLKEVSLFARDGGTAAALAFAQGREHLIRRGVLLNPRLPTGVPGANWGGAATTISQLMLERPQAITEFGAFIRRRSRTEMLRRFVCEGLGAVPADRAALADPAVVNQLVRDMQAQFAHSSAGYAAEHLVYSRGWAPPSIAGGGHWTVLYSGALGDAARDEAPWRGLPGLATQVLDGAGVLAQFTHGEAIVEALTT